MAIFKFKDALFIPVQPPGNFTNRMSPSLRVLCVFSHLPIQHYFWIESKIHCGIYSSSGQETVAYTSHRGDKVADKVDKRIRHTLNCHLANGWR